MSNINLEDRLVEPEKENKKAPLWDFLVSAYSSNKATKVALGAAFAGLSIPIVAAVSGLTYLGFKALGSAVKYATKIIKNPVQALNPNEIVNSCYEAISGLNPFGKYKRPIFVGGALSGVTYLTGF